MNIVSYLYATQCTTTQHIIYVIWLLDCQTVKKSDLSQGTFQSVNLNRYYIHIRIRTYFQAVFTCGVMEMFTENIQSPGSDSTALEFGPIGRWTSIAVCFRINESFTLFYFCIILPHLTRRVARWTKDFFLGTIITIWCFVSATKKKCSNKETIYSIKRKTKKKLIFSVERRAFLKIPFLAALLSGSLTSLLPYIEHAHAFTNKQNSSRRTQSYQNGKIKQIRGVTNTRL